MKSIEMDPIEELVETKAIENLLARFARACDWLAHDELRACFVTGAICHFGPHSLPSEDFIKFWDEMGRNFKARHHLIGLPVIIFKGGGEAFVEVPAIVAGTRADNGVRLRDFMECDRYIFDLTKADGTWRITEARIIIPWSQGGPTPTGMEAGFALTHDATMDHPWFVPLG